MTYKISIIIPIFNVEFYIERCLFSIINQTIGFENLEVILVDDVSNDRTHYIIEKYASRYDNIKYKILDENSGAAGKPRNVGIELASADYIMFIDPDDFFTNDACKRLYDIISQENVDIVSGGHAYKGDNKDYVPFPRLWISTLSHPNEDEKNREKIVRQMFKDNNCQIKFDSVDEMPSMVSNFGLASKIFNRKFIIDKGIDFPINIPAQDSVFLFNSIINAHGIIFINDIIYCYDNNRDDEGNASVSHQADVNRNRGRLSAYQLMLDMSRSKNKEDIYVCYLLNGKLSNFVSKFILKSSLSKEDIEKSLDGYYDLFKLVVEHKCNIRKKSLIPFFEMIYRDEKDSAIDYIISCRP